MELKPFDKQDWDAFAGAEGDAHIGYTDKWLVTTDDNGIFVMPIDGDACWVLSTPNAKAVANLINFELIDDEETLRALGFVRVN